MRSLFHAVLLAGLMVWSWPLAAQQDHSCSDYKVVVNSPEDQLMLAVNGTDDPNAKVAALEKFTQEHQDSTYLHCAEQLLTRNYVALKQYDQAIAAGQKAVAAGYLDVSFLEDLLQAYMASGKASNEAFDLIMKAPAQINAESVVPRTPTESDAQYEAAKKYATERAQSNTNFMFYAFFRLLPAVRDPSQAIKVLEQFNQAYPEAAQKQGGLLNYRFAVAYTQSNQPQKADEYAEKAIASDPNNVEALNLVSYDYALRRNTNQAKAGEYANKVVTLIPTMKKPDGVTDEGFKALQNTQEGMAHLTLGYLALAKTGASHHTAGAIKELKQAADLLSANPELQGQAYYFLGYSYEADYPPEHRLAMAALQQAISIQNSMQGQARALLAKIKSVAR
jgi:tetratricopeptide (TPR) repeat protein